jgi:hypothetical protein
MSEYKELIDKYFTSLNETDGERRRKLIEQVWAENGKFVSPFGAAVGHDAINAKVEKGLEQLAGSEVRRSGDIETLHDCLRLKFEVVNQSGEAFIGGVDFGTVEAGKLQSMVGFFDFAPSVQMDK